MGLELATSTADRATAQRALRETIRAYDNIAAIIAETQTIPEGTVVFALEEAIPFEVAGGGATDHHRTTAGGTKLYVLPGSDGSLNAKAFGATGDGETDDTTALQAAITARGDSGTLRIPAGTYVVSSTLEIALSSTSYAYLEILAYGAVFEISGAIAGLARERPTGIDSVYTNAKIIVRGLQVVGDETTGQHGFRFFTTYGLTLQDCHARKCDIGFVAVFGLMTRMVNCFATLNVTGGFLVASGGSSIDFGSGAETALTGGNQNNSNSNGSVLDQCRVFSASGADYAFKGEACEMEFRNPIAEGNSPANCFEYDNLGSTVSKGVYIRDAHVECEPTSAVYKLHTSTGTNMGGTYMIEGQDTVITTGSWTGALIDLGTQRPDCVIKIVGNKSITGVTTLVKGTHNSTWPQFQVDSVDPADWADAANWDSGTVGNVSSVAKIKDSNNRMLDLRTAGGSKITGFFEWVTSATWRMVAGGKVEFDFTNEPTDDFEIVNQTTGGLVLNGRLKLGGVDTNGGSGFTTLGSIAGSYEIFDDAGASVGHIPIYDSIT